MDRGVVRSFCAEMLTPANRDSHVATLRKIEQQLHEIPDGAPAAPLERESIPRFRKLFAGKELLPSNVFVHALEMKESELVNGQNLLFDGEIIQLRDIMVMAYKPVLLAARIPDKEVSVKLLIDFCMLWFAWESAWLRNREVHAVQALQPLCNAILSLEPLVASKRKEKLLPHPQVIHQKVISYRCLEGFLSAFGDLCAVLMSSLQRVMDHDTRLLVLLDYFVRNDDIGQLIKGCASTPGIVFPHSSGEKLDTEQYILSLGRTSVSVIEGKSRLVLEAFDAVVDALLGLQSTLHEISPQLDHHPTLVKTCAHFERVFGQAKKLVLEPSNLV